MIRSEPQRVTKSGTVTFVFCAEDVSNTPREIDRFDVEVGDTLEPHGNGYYWRLDTAEAEAVME